MTTILRAPDQDGIWREKIIPDVVPPPPAGMWQTDTFSASNGQTAFALSHIPSDAPNLILWVNGVRYTQGVDYSVVVAVVSWSNAAFVLQAGDELQTYYEV